LLNQYADTIGRYNPADLLNVGIDTNLTSGTYYLVVDGVANANLHEYGSLGFYNLSASLLTALPVRRLLLTGSTREGSHDLSWNYYSDDAIKEIHIEYSRDGVQYGFLAKLPAGTRSFTWKPINNNALHYRVKLIVAADERAYYSNFIVIRSLPAGKNIDVVSHAVSNNIRINVSKRFSYRLFDETGRLLDRGTLNQGSNQISTSGTKSGVLFLRLLYGNEAYTERFIKR
jgi:hypothetical protein